MTAEPWIVRGYEQMILFGTGYQHQLLYALNFCIGGYGAWFISRFSYKTRLLDRPSERSSHEISTPKGGGVGILAAFVLSSLVLKFPYAFILSAVMVSLVSFYNDSHGLSPRLRLSIQFVAALVLISSASSAAMPSTPAPLSCLIAFFLAIPLMFFMVGTANFYNFMDGINGMAAITGVMAFGFMAVYGSQGNLLVMPANDPRVVLAICLSFSCLGFLPFNVPKARVFMGDVGSILLGFVFAGMMITFPLTLLDFVCMGSFLFLFYTDELTTMAIRLRDGESLTQPHRRHLYQLLANEWRIPHWKVSLGYGAVQGLIGWTVLILRPYGVMAVLSFLAFCFLGFLFVSHYVRRRPVPNRCDVS